MDVKRHLLVAIAVFSGCSVFVAGQTPSADVTQWRGPNRDGVVASFTAPATWPESLTQKWKIEVGTGYATPLLVGNRMYIFSRQGGDEVMSAINPDTGAVLWHTGYPVSFKMHQAAVKHGEGPKSTPVFAGGKLFSVGMTGVITAFDAATGKQLWQKPGSSVVPMFTTHAFSPVVDRGVVVFHVGGHNEGALTGFDVNTGEVKWRSGGEGPGYGSPIVADLGGTRQLITITQGKMVSVDIASGKALWERPFVSSNFTNSGTPILYGQTIIASGNSEPAVAINVTRKGDEWVTEKVWDNADSPTRFSNSVLVRDAVFGLSSRNAGQYFSVDAKTGKTLWLSEPRQATNAAILRAGDTVFSLQDDGTLVVFKGNPTAFEVAKRYKVADSETWAQPTIAGNRIFVKDVSNLTLWTLN
jgi:outer membrane protein assembly factor BamB